MRLEDHARLDDLVESTILLVEDNEDDILLLERALRNARLANPLKVVKDGEEAIKYLSGDSAYADRTRYPFPFLILLDLRLPRLSGYEVLAWIRDHPDFVHPLPIRWGEGRVRGAVQFGVVIVKKRYGQIPRGERSVTD